MKRFLYGMLAGVLLLLIGGSIVAFGVAKLGLAPVHADAAPSSLERRIFPMIVRAAVSRNAQEQPRATPVTEADLQAGAEIYKAMCAECHGQLNGRASALGLSFYPPAPQLPGHSISYTDAEVFWIVKHGIRNTSMPSWRNLLSDEDIAQVAAFVKRMNSLPDGTGDVSVESNHAEHHEAAMQDEAAH